jgi:hypothetical protein
VRVATKNKVIAPDKSQIYFFEKQKDSLDTVLRPINIDKDGKLDLNPYLIIFSAVQKIDQTLLLLVLSAH